MGCASGDRAGTVGRIEVGEGVGKMVEGTTDNSDVVGVGEIDGQGSSGWKAFEVLGEDLAATAAAFAVFDGVKEGFQIVVGASDKPNASACGGRKRDDMPPKMRAMTIQMREDQINRLTHVFSGTSLGTPLSERAGEGIHSRLNVVEFLDLLNGVGCGTGRFVVEPEDVSKLGKEFITSQERCSEGSEWGPIPFDRVQNLA